MGLKRQRQIAKINENSLHFKLCKAYPLIRTHFLIAAQGGESGAIYTLERMRKLKRELSNRDKILSRTLKKFIKGFTNKAWNQEVEDASTLRSKRRRQRSVYIPRNQERLNSIAQKYWERLGKPKHRKHIVTGAAWQHRAEVTHVGCRTRGSWGSGYNSDGGKIDTRYFGVSKTRDSTTGHVKLKLHVDN